MSERDDRYARNDLPSNTAEFRAAPDISASTAQFKAFASAHDTSLDQPEPDAGSWPEQPWAGESSPSSGSRRTAALVIGAIIAVAVVVTVLLLLV